MKTQSTGANSGADPVVAPIVVPVLPRMQQQAPGAAGAPMRPGDVRIPWKRYTDRALRNLGSNDNLVGDVIAPCISQSIGRHGFEAGQARAQRGYGT